MARKEKNKIKAAIIRDRTLINNALKKHFKKLKCPRALKQAMKYAVFSGGKRLRPILTIESSRMLKGDIKETLEFACAVELVHNFSLVHDDLPAMDNDDTRRGKPTCHRKFGEALAILTGDGLLNLAFAMLAGSGQKNALEAISVLSGAIGTRNMIGGQVLDLEYENHNRKNPRLKNKIDTMKTAALMAASCKIGAIAAKAKTSDIKRIYEFGKNLGHAFQIADDIKDAAHDKISLEKMKKNVRFFISKAKRDITPFGKRAETLRYIADGVLKKETGNQSTETR